MMTYVDDNCLGPANPSPASRKGPGSYCPNPDSQVYVSLITVFCICWGQQLYGTNFVLGVPLSLPSRTSPHRASPIYFMMIKERPI